MQRHPNRIRELRLSRGLSMQALAERAGTSAPQVNKLEKGERKLTVDWMVRLGAALGVDPKDLIGVAATTGGAAAGPGAGTLPAGLPAALGGTTVDFGRPDLPVRGRAQGGPKGVLILPTDAPPIDWTYRPPQLRGVTDAFAIFAYDDSMHPMYKHGQTLWVHPHLPVKPGDGVLVVKASDEAIIKELVRRTDAGLVLRQYRPREEDFTLPQDEVRQVYRIVGALDLR